LFGSVAFDILDGFDGFVEGKARESTSDGKFGHMVNVHGNAVSSIPVKEGIF
jgi:hypothetical protein